MQADLRGGLALELGAQAAEGRALDDGAALADVPAEGLVLTVRRSWGDRGASWLRATFRARRDDPGPSEQVVPGHAVIDAGGIWCLSPALQVRLALGNVLDTEYLGSPDELAVAAPGRSAVVTVSAQF